MAQDYLKQCTEASGDKFQFNTQHCLTLRHMAAEPFPLTVMIKSPHFNITAITDSDKTAEEC